MHLVYPTARSAFLRGQINWSSGGDSFGVALLDSTYTYDPAHEFRSDLTGVLATEALTGVDEIGNGVADADDVAVSGVTVGLIAERYVIYQDTGLSTTDRLVWYADTYVDGTAFYRISDGNPIVISWYNGSSRIFQF